MKNSKKLGITAAALTGIAAVGVGAFAYFSDSIANTVNSLIGTVSVTSTAGMAHKDGNGNALNNVNPGDNDPTVPTTNRNGSDHEITVNVNNTGNKSITTRNVIKIRVLDGSTALNHKMADGSSAVLLWGDSRASGAIGDTVSPGSRTSIDKTKRYQNSTSYDAGTNVYTIVADQYTLSGTGADAEIEKEGSTTCPVSKVYTYDLGLAKEVGTAPIAQAYLNNLEGKKIEVTIEVQAMQFRNTGNTDWQTIFTHTQVAN